MDGETKTKELDLQINRYHFSKSVKNDLLIHVKRSTKAAPVMGLLMFGGMGFLFGYLSIHGYLEEGYHIMMVIYILFSLFMSSIAVALLVQAYSNKRAYYFASDKLVITNSFGLKRTVNKSDVKSVYVQRTLIRDQGSFNAHDYNLWVMLKIPLLKDNGYSLFDVEGRDSLSFMVGVLDDEGMDLAEKESLEIAHLIAQH